MLTVILYNTGGYYLWYSTKQNYLQKEVRKHIREGLKEKDLTLIVVKDGNDGELSWIKKGREFSYKGNLYDIVKIKVRGLRSYYYCINDKSEKKLISDFKKSQSSKKEAEKRIKRLINSNFYSPITLQINKLYTTDFKYPAFDFHYKSGILKIPSPPPRNIS